MGKQKKRETTFSASAVFDYPRNSGNVVLVQETAPHKKGLLTVPGGNEDEGDNGLPYTAKRETKEETGGIGATNPSHGLDIEVDGLISVYNHDTRPNHRVLIFSAFVLSGEMRPNPHHPIVNSYSPEVIEMLHAKDLLRDTHVYDAIHTFLGHSAIPIDLLDIGHIRELSSMASIAEILDSKAA
jgi:ADP-ribose pyrophosphatase YjhB (NUDIX family)